MVTLLWCVRTVAKNHLLYSSYLSVCPSVRSSFCPHVSARSQWTDFSKNWYWDFCENLCRNSTIWLKSQKHRTFYMKFQVYFSAASEINLPERHFCATLICFISLTATYSTTVT